MLGVAIAMRLPPLLAPPFLSSDLNRYIWDGRVQQAGINPYVYVPADPALASLRDDMIYPHVYRADYAPTIYPPMAQVIFAAIAGIAETRFAVKLTMLGFEALALFCVALALRRASLSETRLLIYAWNPVAAWAFAGNGHVDAAAIGFIGCALLARAVGRVHWPAPPWPQPRSSSSYPSRSQLRSGAAGIGGFRPPSSSWPRRCTASMPAPAGRFWAFSLDTARRRG